MEVDDIIVGETYEIRLIGHHGLVKDFSGRNQSDSFTKKYSNIRWNELNLYKAVIIEKSASFRDIVKIVIKDDPPECWALFNVCYLEPMPTPSICNCDIWISGCKCGVFQKEKFSSKEK